MKQELSWLKIGALTSSIPLDYAKFAQDLNAFSIHIDKDFINQNFVKDAHQRGLKVYAYTVDKIEDIKLIGAAFYHAGLRRGNIAHVLLPNCTEYHAIVSGIWMCEGIASLGDPDVTSDGLRSQLQDTKAKFIMCYEGSRSTVYQALKDEDLIGHVQVIILEKACPESHEDAPVSEPGFKFYNGNNCSS